MINVSVCVGEYASNPYTFQSLGISVYCAEELCCCIRENAYLLDTEIMSDTLVDWIDHECGLRELAKQLHAMVHQKGSLSGFASAILRYVGFYEEDVVLQAEQTLKKGAGMSLLERKKTRMDYLTEKKKYAAAIRGYGELLAEWEDGNPVTDGKLSGAADSLKAAILHNRGTAFAGLMSYGKAAEHFLQAYETDGNSESLRCYLAARRMGMTQEDYIAMVAELEEGYEESLRLEQQMKQLAEEWQQEADYRKLKLREALRQDGGGQKYYEDSDRLIQALKESYRSSTG